MLRIKDPVASLKFYVDQLGFTLIDTFDFPQYNFSLYFLTTQLPHKPYTLVPGTQAAHDYLWNMEGVALELTHNHGTEKDDDDTKYYHAGNQERDGFGHMAVAVEDVYAACDKLEAAGYAFQKKPNEGRMKGLAFVLDPDGYWVEIIKRSDSDQPRTNNSSATKEFNLAQTSTYHICIHTDERILCMAVTDIHFAACTHGKSPHFQHDTSVTCQGSYQKFGVLPKVWHEVDGRETF
jgi:lactoylglutathione lyase